MSERPFNVADYVVHNDDLEVVVEHQKLGRRYKHRGSIGIDGVVEPFSTAGYRTDTGEKKIAEQAREYAEEYVDEHLTPFTMYDGEQWWYTEYLCGLSFNERQEFRKLDTDELRELAERLRRGEIELEGDDA